MDTEAPDLKYRGLKTKDVISSIKTYGRDKVCLHKDLAFVQRYVQERRSKGYPVNIFAPQQGAQEEFLRSKASIKCLHGNRGGGKANVYGTGVYTPNGLVKIEDLNIGDIIFNPNGEYQTVEEVFDHKDKDIYEFTFKDGSTSQSTLEHRWLAKITSDMEDGYHKYEDINFTGKVVTTKEIIDVLNHGDENVYIPRCNALEFSDDFYSKFHRSIDPYTFGLSICEIDKIPDDYKYAPISERIKLTQGIIDHNEELYGQNKVIFIRNENVAKDIQWIFKSLGRACVLKYDALFFPAGYAINNESINQIISYKYIGKKNARCLTVSGENKLYVIDDFVVTHNTVVLGMEALKTANEPSYSALVFRKDKTSAEKADGILKVISTMLEPYGEYIDSKRLSRLDAGGEVRYDYFGDACQGGESGIQAFYDRQQGANVTKVLIDEAAQAPESVINYLQTVLRSSAGLKTSMSCAMNPNPYSEFWRTLVSWYIDDDGIAIPERSGKIRYFYQYGDTISDTAWGNTPEEVFEQAGDYIKAKFEKKGRPVDETNCHQFIKNITFIASDLQDNKIMLNSNPDYEKNLGGTTQEVSINALGSWKLIKGGNEWITRDDMDDFFNNEPCYEDMFSCATLDIAYGLGDVLIMGRWIGHHLEDIRYSNQIRPRQLNSWVRNNLWEWGIGENMLAFDGLGAPTFRDEFPESHPILRGVEKDKTRNKNDQPVKFYYDLRSQLADNMVTRLKGTNTGHCGFSINPDLLDRPYINQTIKEAFLNQRRAIRRDIERENGKLRLLQKKDAKKIVGCSPDLIEGTLLYRTYFDVCDVFIEVDNSIYESLKRI